MPPIDLSPMPLRRIKKMIIEENDSYFLALLAPTSPVLMWKDYTNELMQSERTAIGGLPTYEAVNDWLLENRKLTLNEWIESL